MGYGVGVAIIFVIAIGIYAGLKNKKKIQNSIFQAPPARV